MHSLLEPLTYELLFSHALAYPGLRHWHPFGAYLPGLPSSQGCASSHFFFFLSVPPIPASSVSSFYRRLRRMFYPLTREGKVRHCPTAVGGRRCRPNEGLCFGLFGSSLTIFCCDSVTIDVHIFQEYWCWM